MIQRYLGVLFCVILAAAFALPTASIATSKPVSGGQDGKEWTLLIYWDADNNLEFCTEFAMQTWANALTSDEYVNLVAYVDILSENGTWIYEVHDGECHTAETWEELDSSDPATLRRFLEYGLQNYPAEKTMLVLQDHGYSWRGLCLDDTDSGDIMLIDEMAQAIRDASDACDTKVDMLSLDACSVAAMEIAYELRNTVDWFAASQMVVPYDGLPYDLMIRALVEEPAMTPGELSHDMVDMYMEYYSSRTLYEHIYPYDQNFVSFSAFDMSLVDELGEAFMDMTEVLEPLVSANAEVIGEAWDHALIGMWANVGGWEYLPDVYTLFSDLKGIDSELDVAIDAFLAAFDAALVNNGSSPRFDDVPSGLNINFPPNLALYNGESWKWAMQFVYHDIGLDLVDGSSWVNCLMEYYFSAPGTQLCPNHVID